MLVAIAVLLLCLVVVPVLLVLLCLFSVHCVIWNVVAVIAVFLLCCAEIKEYKVILLHMYWDPKNVIGNNINGKMISQKKLIERSKYPNNH